MIFRSAKRCNIRVACDTAQRVLSHATFSKQPRDAVYRYYVTLLKVVSHGDSVENRSIYTFCGKREISVTLPLTS